MKQLFICRHGETEWSLSGRHTSRTDLPLTERGKEQAAFLKKRLSSLAIDCVISSPMLRARTTCELAGFSDYLVEPLAKEWDYGDYEGLSFAEIREKDPHWTLVHNGAPNGESCAHMTKRVDHLIKNLEQMEGNCLLFAHGHLLKSLAARWLGLEIIYAAHFTLSVASLGSLSYERGNRVISLWNST